jgi:hypothetical protein
MAVDGKNTRITTSDTSDGVAIVFTTQGNVNDLRARVRRMADKHNEMHGGAAPSRATEEDIPGGARLLLVPNRTADTAAVRQQARRHVAMMQKGQCPMMEPSSRST